MHNNKIKKSYSKKIIQQIKITFKIKKMFKV